jgi:hypothetical protein
MYSRGWGVPRDEADALRWFQMANSVESDGPSTDWTVVERHGIRRTRGKPPIGTDGQPTRAMPRRNSTVPLVLQRQWRETR